MTMKFIPMHNHSPNKAFKSWDKPTEDNKTNLIDEEAIAQQKKVDEIYQQAYQQGLAQAEQEIEQYKSQLADLTSLIFNPVNLIDEKLELEVIKTVIWFCHYCIDIELTQSPEKLIAIFQQIKPHLPLMKHGCQLLLNPQDSDNLKTCFSQDTVEFDLNAIVEDSSLNRGEFRLIGNTSEVDGRFEERLNAIMQSN